ncbi:MAG: hypothetical protein PHE16_11560 [Aliarcobacter sp.]|nr:hypothetical protein [Aliarcobacter sp.]
MDNNRIVDISKLSRIVTIVSVVIPLIIAIFVGVNSNEEFLIWTIIILISFWLASYIFEKGKVILRVGSIIDKDKRFYLTDNGKKIDTLRIRIEEDVSEKEVLKRLEDFLIKNNVKQYSKLYVVGSNSKDSVEIIQNILSK